MVKVRVWYRVERVSVPASLENYSASERCCSACGSSKYVRQMSADRVGTEALLNKLAPCLPHAAAKAGISNKQFQVVEPVLIRAAEKSIVPVLDNIRVDPHWRGKHW